MDIALVAHVKDDPVPLRGKDPVEGHGELHRPQVGGQVPPGLGDVVHQELPKLLTEERKLFRPSVPETIEAPAKHINMVSEPVPMPDFDAPEEEPAKASEPPAPEEAPGEGKPEDQEK